MEQKMHGVLHEVREGKRLIDFKKDLLSKRFQEPICTKETPKDTEESSPATRSSDSRCNYLAFLTLESDGIWRIAALPLCYLDHNNIASGLNMDGLRHVLPLYINAYEVDHRKGQYGHSHDKAHSHTGRSIPGSYMRRHLRNNGTNALKENCGKTSSHNLESMNNSSVSNIDCLTPVHRPAMLLDSSKTCKTAEKISKKKARKMSRLRKKLSSDTRSAETETRLEELGHENSTSEECGNYVDNCHKFVLSSSESQQLSSDGTSNKKDYKGNRDSEPATVCEVPIGISAYIDEEEISETSKRMVRVSTTGASLYNLQNQLQTKSSELLTDAGEVDDGNNLQRHFCDYQTSCDVQDSLALDTISIGSNSDVTNADNCIKQSQKESCGSSSSDPNSCDTRGDQLMCHKLINDVGNLYNQAGGVKYPIESNNSEKKVKQNKLVNKSYGVSKFGFPSNLHGRDGKENSHSVWQKVQRNYMNECTGELKKLPSDASRMASSLKRNCDFVNINSKAEEKKQSTDMLCGQLKRKTNATLKQEVNCCSRKEAQSNEAILDDYEKTGKQRNGISHSSQKSARVSFSALSRTHVNTKSKRNESQITRAVSTIPELVHYQQISSDEQLSVKDDNSVSTIEIQRLENVENAMRSCNFDNQSSLCEGQPPMHLSHGLAVGPGEIQKEVALVCNNKQSHYSGLTVQKWVPIGLKDSVSVVSVQSEDSVVPSDRFTTRDSALKDGLVGIGELGCRSVISSNLKAATMHQIVRNSNSLSQFDPQQQKSWNQDPCRLTLQSSHCSVANCFTIECQPKRESEIYTCRIGQAVSEACRMQLASEAIQVASGSPIAEFERFLYFCAPVISQSPDFLNCLTCTGGNTLCRHELPNLSLGCLWQWYEKHGSYGLEVRGQDYENAKRLGSDRFAYRAYFVPLLSAVQLFKNSNRHSHSEDFGGCKIVDNSESSTNVGQVPIFSVLFPRPNGQGERNPTPADQMSCSERSSDSAECSPFDHSVDSTCCDEPELFYEYFESQQPQQRPPLYNKIMELIIGDGVSQSKMFGDPTCLDSINLRDLHPKSWYSVAWYPIYQIPDSSFRAAFLTYHSLGHLVLRSNKINFPSEDTCVISPVVGLQSYNAQGECWFQLRQSALSETIRESGLNPSWVLRERLRTLEETASVMSRAVVNKGNLISTNRHHDYEFFVSRRQ